MEPDVQLIPVSSTTGTEVALRVPELLRAFLSGRNRRTLEAYHRDLEDFASFVTMENIDHAAGLPLSRGHGPANALALAYRAALLERGLSPATINRRLAALRSLVKVAGTLGIVPWNLEVSNVKSKAYRDTRGPGQDGFRRLLGEVEARRDRKGMRDRAILRLLYDLALRRGEVVGLDLNDVDLEAGKLAVLGKGRTEKQLVTLPEPTKNALRGWIVVRGTEPGPVFVNVDRAGKGCRLTGCGLYYLVRKAGKDAGLTTRPHALWHSAITAALDLSRGDIRAVQKFSRHSDPRTLNVYDDNRADMAGEIARKVASEV